MKIDDRLTITNPSPASVHTGKPAKPAGGPAEQTVLKPDTVALSSKARQLQQAEKALRALPDIRTEKVAAIKSRIRNGTYAVDSEKIAAKMIKDAISSRRLIPPTRKAGDRLMFPRPILLPAHEKSGRPDSGLLTDKSETTH